MDESNSFFKKLFGNKLGEMIQFSLGFFLIMMLFIAFPAFITKLYSPVNQETSHNQILKNFKETSQNIYKELNDYDSLTSKMQLRINQELLKEKEFINRKRELLFELQKDFDSIVLTPSQIRLLSSVGVTRTERISFRVWISSANQIYNIAVSFLISFIFYFLGRRAGKQTKLKNE